MLRFIVSVLAISFGLACQAQEPVTPFIKLGSHGAGFKAISAWKRGKLNADLGNDQFTITNRGTCYLIVIEQEIVLETKEDFQAALGETVSRLIANTLPISKMVFQWKDKQGHAFQSFKGEAGGLGICYQIHVISRDGLTYLMLFWSTRSNALELTWEATQRAASFRFPKTETLWAKRTIPKTYRFQSGPYELSFSARTSVFDDESSPDNLVDFISIDQSHEIHVIETTGYSLNEVLKGILDTINEDYGEKPFKEIERQDRKLSELTGRMIVCSNGDYTLHLVAVKLNRNNYLDIRYTAKGVPSQSRFDRDLFLKSLSLSIPENKLQLPDLEQATEIDPFNSHEKFVYEQATLVGRTQLAYPHSCHRLLDGRFLVTSNTQVVLVSNTKENLEDSTDELIYFTDQWNADLKAIHWQRRWLVTGADDELLHVDAQVSKPADIRGKFMVASGDRLFVAVPHSKSSLLGMTFEPLTGPGIIMEYGPEKKSRQIASFTNEYIKNFAVDGEVANALVVLSPKPNLDHSMENTLQLVLLDLASSQKRSLGNWQQIEQICAAEDWWLVTGQPQDLPEGIYRVDASHDPEPLLTGTNLLGIAVVDQEIFFGSNLATEPMVETSYQIYKISLADLLPQGPLCRPFNEALWNRIAARWLAQYADGELPAPRTEKDIHQLVDNAQEVSKELAGRELPHNKQEVDSLCNSFTGSDQLSRPGRMLVSLIVASCLLENGADWVESDKVEAMDWLVPESLDSQSPFAIGYTVASIISSVLDDSEGFWTPSQTIFSIAEGRNVLLGLNRSVVEQAMRKKAPNINVEQIFREGSATEVLSLFDLVPENEHLRQIVYKQLAIEPRQKVLSEVTRQMAARPNAALVDKLAWSIIRCSKLESQKDAKLMASDLNMLLKQHPKEAALYLILGKVYEIATPEMPQHSRACYVRVQEISSWGKVAEDAEKRLQALENGNRDSLE